MKLYIQPTMNDKLHKAFSVIAFILATSFIAVSANVYPASNSIWAGIGFTTLFTIIPLFFLTQNICNILNGTARRVQDILLLLGNAELVIFNFAQWYLHYGLNDSGKVVYNMKSALYFSVITFTTVGYGDVVPTVDSRLIAGIEAFTGYCIMALIVASIVVVITEAGKPKQNSQTNP